MIISVVEPGKPTRWEYRVFDRIGKYADGAASITVRSFEGSYAELMDHFRFSAFLASEEGNIGLLISLIFILLDEVRNPSA